MRIWEARWRQHCPIGGHLKFFLGRTQKIAKNLFFRVWSNFLRLWFMFTYTGYHHVKWDVGCIWGVGVFILELLLLKVGGLWNFGYVGKNKRCHKKQHSCNNEFWVPKRKLVEDNPIGYIKFKFQASNPKIQVLFFCDTRFCCWNLTWIWQLITMA